MINVIILKYDDYTSAYANAYGHQNSKNSRKNVLEGSTCLFEFKNRYLMRFMIDSVLFHSILNLSFSFVQLWVLLTG